MKNVFVLIAIVIAIVLVILIGEKYDAEKLSRIRMHG